MRDIVRRHLGKVVAAAAVAAAGSAALIGISLPGTAGADEVGGAVGGLRAATQTSDDPYGVRPGIVEQAPTQGAKGTGRDPLTGAEIQQAESTVRRQQLSGATNVSGGRGPQRLSVDLSDPAADEFDASTIPRRADVVFYDYKSDELVTSTVNLQTSKVERTVRQRGVQPPLSREENAAAARRLIEDPLGAGLRADYKDATGHALTSPGQLLLNGAVYRSTRGGQPPALDRCGEHRCVRLFPKIKEGPWIDARSLVVDLSAGKVVRIGRH